MNVLATESAINFSQFDWLWHGSRYWQIPCIGKNSSSICRPYGEGKYFLLEINSPQMEPDTNLSAVYPTEIQLPKDSVLQQLIVVCRHGQRTPMIERFNSVFPKLWPFCTSQNIIKRNNQLMPGVCYYGQLTDLGKMQMFTLGNYLKQYPLNFENVFVRSTNIPRALETAQNVIRGIGIKSLINVEFTNAEDSLYPPNNCEKMTHLIVEFQTKFFKENRKQLESLSKTFDYTGLSTHPLFDTLASWFSHQMNLPAHISASDFDTFRNYASQEHWGPYMSELGAKLGIGRLMGDITKYLNSSHDFVLLSGHDSTLAPLLGAFGVMDLNNLFWPAYGSALMIEKINWRDKIWARLRFNEQICQIPKCRNQSDGWCPIDEFLKITKEMTPADFDKECSLTALN
eukprot:NODE_180_length_13923_cov_0.697772.p5 type:complete len:400 gc:universal NODE_180_length_13923_cov_0.697772:10776-9577(-)